MLRKFIVSNFKSFEKDFVLDLTESNGYEFNPECVKNQIVNNAVIYGRNGVGKSNLALAIFDIIEHLTDKNKEEDKYKNYLNSYNKSKTAKFYYEFLIDSIIVGYEYIKSDYKTLIFEKLSINGKEVIRFDRENDNNQFTVQLKGAETLNTTIKDNQLSVVKYIKNNTVLEENQENKTFSKWLEFIDKMLYFRSLEDRIYLGSDSEHRLLGNEIIEKNNVQDFEFFLNEAGIECKLSVVKEFNKKTLVFDFDGKKIPFFEIASTGTSSLTLFYFWYQSIRNSNVSFLFIDEFDAFYHHELSAMIVRKLKQSGVQFILSTHNTSIMTNDLFRPDCCFLMHKNKINPLSKCTTKELREAHNLEKMYKAGTFNGN